MWAQRAVRVKKKRKRPSLVPRSLAPISHIKSAARTLGAYEAAVISKFIELSGDYL
jgi:hypothetical protein